MGFSPSKHSIGILTPHNSNFLGLLFLVPTFSACIRIFEGHRILIVGVLRDNSPIVESDHHGARPIGGECLRQ